MTTVLVARHGETDWNRERRIQGWAPTRLTDRGREQAGALGAHLAATYDVDRIASSDLVRTRETTERVRRHVDAGVRYAAAWRERDFGIYQGLTYDDLDERLPDAGVHEVGAQVAVPRAESGEDLVDLRDRIVDAWDRLVAGMGDETVLVVTHGGGIYALLAELEGIDIETSVREHDPANCGLTEVRLDGDPRIVRENDTGYRRG